MFTETVGPAPLVVKVPDDTESQLPLLDAEAVYVTFGPVAVTLNVCGFGLEPPTAPLKVNADGVGMWVTLNVTCTVTGLFDAPVAFSAIVPVLAPGPGARDGLALTEIDEPVVPLVGDTDSQLPVLDGAAVNGTDSDGVVATETFCAPGTDEFTEVKVSGLG